ncbi:MAG: polyphosphate kinase 1 [Acidobacteria bacterium]|nr:polyphosphate kinase 1 [Acidobacteriota bacterium]
MHSGVSTVPFANDATSSGLSAVADVPFPSFFDRDLSQLRFQERVLEEAQDGATPLLERVKFLSIVGTNLDDFVSTRGPVWRADAAKRLVIEAIVKRLFRDAHVQWHRTLVPALAAHGLHFVGYESLDSVERQDVDEHFTRVGRVAVAPCELDSSPSGTISVPSFGLNFAVVTRAASGDTRLAVVRVPESLSPLVPFHPSDLRRTSGLQPASSRGYVWLDEVIESHLAEAFPGQTIVSAYRFRITRQAEPPTDSASMADALAHAARVVSARDSNPVVSLVVDRRMPRAVLERLARALRTPAGSVYQVSVVTNPRRYWEVSRIARTDLHYPVFHPDRPDGLDTDVDIFAEIRRRDILLHHPFDAFDPVVELVRQAAEDPDVLRISITLYRTDRESLIAHALLEALKRGKQVRVVIELHARMDERRNIKWAREFVDAGAQVSYGDPGRKVHTKMAVIARHEGTRIRRYAHVSSGNYHAFNARTYTDLALLTCDDAVAADIDDLFSLLSGAPGSVAFRSIHVSPVTLRGAIGTLIQREIDWARRGRTGRIILKTNALLDEEVIRQLYLASQAGVSVDLIVRGMCALRPGVPGLSDRITVRSVVGRFLEHSRVWYFRNGGDDDAYVGSADLRPRNLDQRVEVMVRIASRAMVARLRDEILTRYIADNVNARLLRPDGVYVRAPRASGEPAICAQRELLVAAEGRRHDRPGPSYVATNAVISAAEKDEP